MRISNMDIPEYETPEIKDFPHKVSQKLYCRDPFILRAGKTYYLYRTARERGIECLLSRDLENWSEPFLVYERPSDHHGKKDLFWAPECHYYKGNFYIFTSVWSEMTGHRCISVYRSDKPLGPFFDIAGGCVSPREWDCIDGTLYVDEEGQPWLVFVHEWTCMPDHVGAMAAAKLSEDLSHLISEPIQLFLANEPEWTKHGVTDGPFIAITKTGKMIMTWSNFIPEYPDDAYAIGVSYSESGKITGPWKHRKKEIYSYKLKPDFIYDGGHSMMFYDNGGNLKITFHAPNATHTTYEHVNIKDVVDLGDTVEIM